MRVKVKKFKSEKSLWNFFNWQTYKKKKIKHKGNEKRDHHLILLFLFPGFKTLKKTDWNNERNFDYSTCPLLSVTFHLIVKVEFTWPSCCIGQLLSPEVVFTAHYTECPCTMQHTTAHCSTQQHTTTHNSTLQHTTTQCSTLQHTTSNYSTIKHTITH